MDFRINDDDLEKYSFDFELLCRGLSQAIESLGRIITKIIESQEFKALIENIEASINEDRRTNRKTVRTIKKNSSYLLAQDRKSTKKKKAAETRVFNKQNYNRNRCPRVGVRKKGGY